MMDLDVALKEETVATVGYRDKVTIDVGARVRDAIDVMQTHGVGCILVVDGETLRGIFTERDLVVRVLSDGGAASLDRSIADAMTPEPCSVRPQDPIHQVLATMRSRGLRHLPVVDAASRPLGTISIKRAVHFLAAYMPQVIHNLPPEPDRFPDRPEGG